MPHTFRESLELVKTPYEYDEEIRVHIIGLSYTKEPEMFKQFINYARTKGRDTFADYGYVK